jgi:outer membrane protein assembly factor BamB
MKRFDVPPSCFSYLGPGVTAEGSAYVTGVCADFNLGTGVMAARHAPDGTLLWSYPRNASGWTDAGLAVAADGSAVLLHDDAGGVLVTRIATDGQLVRRDTLNITPAVPPQRKAPAIAEDGDVYVWWYNDEGARLSRVAAEGGVRWTVSAPAVEKFHTSPALAGGRVAIASDRLVVHDTSGTLQCDVPLSTSGTSTPVFDDVGNIYIQSSLGLSSYDVSGALRWSADSLGASCYGGIGAPSLLADGQLLVACSWELCSVDASDGSLNWRTNLQGTASHGICGSATVAADGTIYVLVEQYSPDWAGLVALHGNSPPLVGDWTTEGGGMGRLRRQPP